MRCLALVTLVAHPLQAAAQPGSTPSEFAAIGTVSLEMHDVPLKPHLVDRVRQEVRRVWQSIGLAVEWPAAGTIPHGTCALVKVVFDDDEPGLASTPGRHPLGVVYRVGSTWRRAIFVSPAAVMRLVLHGASQPAAATRVEVLHATMIGRVIAHELGHILLASDSHAGQGLMRGRFRASDATRQGEAQVGLDAADRSRIARRCAGTAVTPALLASARNAGPDREPR